jgi:hypothetical protein
LPTSEETTSEVHEFGNGPTVADEFQQLRGDEGHGFRVVEPNAPGEALLGEGARRMQGEFVEVARS